MRERLKLEEIMNLDLLLVPKGVVLPAEAGVVHTAANIRELVRLVDAESAKDVVPVVHIEDTKVLDILNRNYEVFPFAIAVLDEVPGGDYGVVFDNHTHLLSSITVGELIESASKDAGKVNAAAQATFEGKTVELNNSQQRRADKIIERTSRRNEMKAPVPESISDALGDLRDEGLDDDEREDGR